GNPFSGGLIFMVRNISVVLGIGLAVLWAVGLGSPDATGWLTWMDGVGAVCAFIVASGGRTYGRAQTATGFFGMAVGLFALWIIGLATGATPWLSWWTFGFACAFTGTAIAASRTPEGAATPRMEANPVTDTTRQYTDDSRRAA
ncbi:MAG: hypothetical protein ACXWP5_06325, partial [Bdellovibrionota bacterium]